jgi:hypothetical protein
MLELSGSYIVIKCEMLGQIEDIVNYLVLCNKFLQSSEPKSLTLFLVSVGQESKHT